MERGWTGHLRVDYMRLTTRSGIAPIRQPSSQTDQFGAVWLVEANAKIASIKENYFGKSNIYML